MNLSDLMLWLGILLDGHLEIVAWLSEVGVSTLPL
jgi:hypothetical protein